MTTFLLLLPLLAVLVLAGAQLVSWFTLCVRYLHPWRIALRVLGAATTIGVIGLASVLPDSLWWLLWLPVVLTIGAAAIALRRLLVSHPPSRPTPKEAKLLTRPSIATIAVDIAFYVALVVVALLAG